MAKKLVNLDNVTRLVSALDSRMKNKIGLEELRARGEESNLLQAINEVKTMLGGKSLVYLTQAEYNSLSEEERNDEDIMYFITDAENLSHTHANMDVLNSLDEEFFAGLDSEITDLKNNKVNKSEYETEIGELTTNITNEIDRATEKENEIISTMTTEVARVEGMLGGKSLVYLTQAEYNGLSEEERNNENKMYFITDAKDLSHIHDNLELLNSLDEEYFANLDSDIKSLKDNKVDKSEYETGIDELTTNITNEVDRATEKENEIISTMTTEVTRVETMLGGKSFVYLTQAEYDSLSEEEKSNEDKIYFITDAKPDAGNMSHAHDNLEFLNSLNETDYMQLGADITDLKNGKVNKSEYETKINEFDTNITNEINRATEKENEIIAEVAKVKGMLGGKSLVYITQAEYDVLSEEEKNDESKTYFITDEDEGEDISHIHDNLELLNSLDEEFFADLDSDITDLKNNKVNKSEYETKIGELTTNITNEVNRATEKEEEIIAEVTKVETMLGGKSLVYITQAEYDNLSEEEKNNEDIIYFVIDAEDISHVHDNMEFLDSLNEDIFNDIDSAIRSLENNKLDASIYNEVIPGLKDNSHTHENQDFLDELNEEEFAQMNADIAALKTSVSGKVDKEHNHDDMYYTESEIDEKIEDINEAINGHVSGLQGAINTAKSGAISESKIYADTAITNLVDSAPDAMNTLNDLAKAINAHQTEYEAYVATVSSSITSAKNEAISEAGNKDEALYTIISKEIDDGVKKEYDRAVGVETGLQASITSLTNNKVNVAKYNDEVPGLLTAKHTHANMNVLNQISSDTFAKINADITTLDTNKMNKADAEKIFISGGLSDDITGYIAGEEYKLAWLGLGEYFISPGVSTKTIFHDSNSDGEDENLNTYLHDIDNAVSQATADITTLKNSKMNKADADAKYITAHVSEEEAAAGVAISQLTLNGVVIKPMVASDDVYHGDLTLNYCLESLNNDTSTLAASIGDGNKLLTDAKATIVDALNELQTEINILQDDVDDFELALDTVDAIKLNGYSIWVGTSEELNNIAQRDPKTLYFEISDEEEDSEEVVQVNPVNGVLTLTTNKYQKTTIADGTEIVFPEVNKFTEIHLYFDAASTMNLTFPECKWRVDPNIEAGKSYEIVATYNTVHWLVNVIVYS